MDRWNANVLDLTSNDNKFKSTTKQYKCDECDVPGGSVGQRNWLKIANNYTF